MKISIILPFYNEGKTVGLTLKSLQNQTLQADEIIFVDSGSTDDSIKIINEYILKSNQKNIKVLHSGKMNPSSSVNLGIKAAKNKMVMYMDCGLEVPSKWVESQVNLYDIKNPDIVSGRIYTYGVNSIDKCFIAHTYGYKNKCVCLTGSLFNKNLMEKYGFFIENSRAGYDVGFINILKENKCVRYINENIYLKYYGTNYASNILNGFKKVYLYSQSAWKAYGDKKPSIYFGFFFLMIIALLVDQFFLWFAIYIFTRGILLPFLKSKEILKMNKIKIITLLPFVGIIFDIARFSGYIKGYFISKLNTSL
jgi:glycosyltransferase involved in cell wall biosynthesis